MCKINARLAARQETKKDLCQYVHAPAAYQGLGLQAQINAGVSTSRRVAIYTFNPENSNASKNVQGCAGPGYMVLRETAQQDSFCKFIACHEAEHILNNDSAVRFLLEHPECVRAFIKSEEQEEFNKLLKELKEFCQNFDIYALAETNADICAAYQVNCCDCISQMANAKQAAHLLSDSYSKSQAKLGYICHTTLFAIAQDLKNHGRYCPLHKPPQFDQKTKIIDFCQRAADQVNVASQNT